MKPMITIEELAEMLKVSPRTIYRMLEKEELPFAIKIQGSWRFMEEDIMAWLERQKMECKK
jgi:excisionase family DNA binding protein